MSDEKLVDRLKAERQEWETQPTETGNRIRHLLDAAISALEQREAQPRLPDGWKLQKMQDGRFWLEGPLAPESTVLYERGPSYSSTIYSFLSAFLPPQEAEKPVEREAPVKSCDHKWAMEGDHWVCDWCGKDVAAEYPAPDTSNDTIEAALRERFALTPQDIRDRWENCHWEGFVTRAHFLWLIQEIDRRLDQERA